MQAFFASVSNFRYKLSMTLPYLHAIGLGVFTICAVLAAGFLFMEEPSYSHSSFSTHNRFEDKYDKELKKDQNLIALMEMGFSKEEAENALFRANNDLHKASLILLQEPRKEDGSVTTSIALKRNEQIMTEKDLETMADDIKEQETRSLIEEYERSVSLLDDANEAFEKQKNYLMELEIRKNIIESQLHQQMAESTTNTSRDSPLPDEALLKSVSEYQSCMGESIDGKEPLIGLHYMVQEDILVERLEDFGSDTKVGQDDKIQMEESMDKTDIQIESQNKPQNTIVEISLQETVDNVLGGTEFEFVAEDLDLINDEVFSSNPFKADIDVLRGTEFENVVDTIAGGYIQPVVLNGENETIHNEDVLKGTEFEAVNNSVKVEDDLVCQLPLFEANLHEPSEAEESVDTENELDLYSVELENTSRGSIISESVVGSEWDMVSDH
jgi:hypothetical protein